MSERVAVVIPYFQRQPGLLARALRSVFNQRGAIDMLVIVIDDSSPVPAESELDMLDAAHRQAVQVIRQPNAGAGAARNAGLDAIPDDTAYTALLDPDDVWEENHIGRALDGMRLGYDFYFCDIRREGDSEGHFSRCGLSAEDHEPIGHDGDLYAFSGDFFDRSLRHSPVATSTVVMRRSRLGHLRFSSTIRPVGEDLLFWLDAARSTSRVAFSTQAAAVYGEGVSGSWSNDWAAAKSLLIISAYGTFYDQVRRRFALTAEQAFLVNERIRQFQVHFAYTLFGMIKRRRWPGRGVVGAYIRRNPRILLTAPMILVMRLAGRRP